MLFSVMESEDMTMTEVEDTPSPTEALASIRKAQAAAADGFSRHTWGYDLTYSVLASGIIAFQALHMPLNVVFTCLCTVGLTALARKWSEKHGVKVTGLTPRGGRWIALGLGAIFIVLAFGAFLSVERFHARWIPLALGVVAFFIALAASRLWRRSYRREMGLDQ